MKPTTIGVIGFAATCAYLAASLLPGVASAQAVILDGKPMLTKAGTPLCVTKQGLSDMLAHVRAGNPEPPLAYGCFMTPESWSVSVVETEGVIDVWAKVILNRPDGTKSDFLWTVLWMLKHGS